MKMKALYQVLLFACCIIVFLTSCSGQGSKAIRVGDAITSFSGSDLNGRSFSLAALNGKPVIVRFFLINCPYCKADTPIFNAYYEKYRAQGLEIVYINNNGKDVGEVETFSRELNIDFPVIYDPQGKIAKQYNVKVQPLTMVLSPEHKLLAALLGGVSEAELHELLGRYFQ